MDGVAVGVGRRVSVGDTDLDGVSAGVTVDVGVAEKVDDTDGVVEGVRVTTRVGVSELPVAVGSPDMDAVCAVTERVAVRLGDSPVRVGSTDKDVDKESLLVRSALSDVLHEPSVVDIVGLCEMDSDGVGPVRESVMVRVIGWVGVGGCVLVGVIASVSVLDRVCVGSSVLLRIGAAANTLESH
eukprot:PhM_4_TR3016/c2_g1_i1/m.89337